VNSAVAEPGVYQLMTATDWFGLGLSILLFVLVIVVYVYVIVPRWGGKLENNKYMIFDRDLQKQDK